MKIDFIFKMLCRAAGLFTLLCAAAPTTGHAEGVYWSTRELLSDFFRTSTRVTYQKIELRGELRARIEARLGYAMAKESYTVYVASTGAHIDGYAVVDDEIGEHLPITFAVKISPQGRVERQEVVVYREPRGDEVRDARFRRQFIGKSAHDALRAGDDVAVISGATISSRAMAVGVKRVLVVVEESLLRGGDASAPPRS